MAGPSIKDIKIVSEIDRLEKDMQFMKSRQFVGRKVLVTKISKAGFLVPSHDVWSVGGPPDPPTAQGLQHEVTFKADTQLNPWGMLQVEFYDSQGQQIVNAGDGITAPGIEDVSPYVTFEDDGMLKWYIGLLAPVSMPFSVKWVVAATDSGTITSVDVYNA